MDLAPSERFRPQAEQIMRMRRTRLRDAGIPGTLELGGGGSVDGAITKGDVDLHLRVEPARFDFAVARLRGMFAVVHPEIWCVTLATFEVPADLPTGLAVTPIGAEHDVRFSRVWHMLAADPTLLTEYNAMKRDAAAANYEQRKSEFFDDVLDRWVEQP
jgi:GrpB-like predicted nucleotidyltransferase (UPF0157 family)